MCSLRSRLVVRDYSCAICRQQLEVVLCTSAADTPFAEQMKKHTSTTASSTTASSTTPGAPMMRYAFYAPAQMWVPAQYMSAVLSTVLQYKCKVCDEALGDMTNIRNIKRHLLEKHDLMICEVCNSSDNRHIFPSELEVYTSAGLQKHMTGVQEGSTGVSGHPLCSLCNKHFYDSGELFHGI